MEGTTQVTRNTSIIIVSIVGVFLLLFVTLALIVGPSIYREGRAFLGPIVEMAGVKEEFKTLNEELSFVPPESGLVTESRLLVFLDMREELKEVYEKWREVVRTVEKEHPDSWQGAKDVLTVTRDVIKAQVEVLRHHGMSAAEFRWLEDRVYREWLDQINHLLEDAEDLRLAGQLRRTAEEDLAFVGKLARQHGSSPMVEAMRRRLEQRLAELESPEMPMVPDIPTENQRLYWKLKERIAALILEEYEMHNVYRDPSAVSVHIGDVPEVGDKK
jgi:hypothetical protein